MKLLSLKEKNSGETVEEYVNVFNKVRELEQIELCGEKPVIYYEINASCRIPESSSSAKGRKCSRKL